MKTALICPGPSLGDSFPGREGFDVVVAVNSAGATHPCDWWAAIDAPTFLESGMIIPPCSLLTNGLARGQLAGRTWAAVVVTEDLREFCPVPGWTLFTSTSAVVHLAKLGATEIHAYGVSWEPGDTPERSAERFKTERCIWDRLTEWLAGRGVTIELVTQTQEESNGKRRPSDIPTRSDEKQPEESADREL